MGELRIGSVPYLNAKPLIEGLSGVVLDVPSRLTGRFRRGELDVALLPSYEAARRADRAFVPGICVGSPGPVDSVLIFSRGPVEESRRVALDESSLTSSALARILFGERWGRTPEFSHCPPDVDPREADADAVLLIGDPAMRAPRDGLVVTDVATAWREWTGLPFPFALWIASDVETARAAAPVLAAAKERGLARRGEIAAEAAAAMDLPPEFLLRYLTSRITYDFGEGEAESLQRYA
ncbi:MAG: menaquinone biosynthesis protein, partial [Planctomycetota bacterium]